MIEFFFAFSTCSFLSREPPELTGMVEAGLCGECVIMMIVTTTRAAVKNNEKQTSRAAFASRSPAQNEDR